MARERDSVSVRSERSTDFASSAQAIESVVLVQLLLSHVKRILTLVRAWVVDRFRSENQHNAGACGVIIRLDLPCQKSCLTWKRASLSIAVIF